MTVKEKEIAGADEAALILWKQLPVLLELFGVQCGGYFGRCPGKNDVVMKVKQDDQCVAPQMTRYHKFYDWLCCKTT